MNATNDVLTGTPPNRSRAGSPSALKRACWGVMALLSVLSLSSCSSVIYKTGWHPKPGTPRAEIVARLGEPVSSKLRKDLPGRIGFWPESVTLKDPQGREDRYVSRLLVRNDPAERGALFVNIKLFGVSEVLIFPYAVVDHWIPRRRVLEFYYDRGDRLQGYYSNPRPTKLP